MMTLSLSVSLTLYVQTVMKFAADIHGPQKTIYREHLCSRLFVLNDPMALPVMLPSGQTVPWAPLLVRL